MHASVIRRPTHAHQPLDSAAPFSVAGGVGGVEEAAAPQVHRHVHPIRRRSQRRRSPRFEPTTSRALVVARRPRPFHTAALMSDRSHENCKTSRDWSTSSVQQTTVAKARALGQRLRPRCPPQRLNEAPRQVDTRGAACSRTCESAQLARAGSRKKGPITANNSKIYTCHRGASQARGNPSPSTTPPRTSHHCKP